MQSTTSSLTARVMVDTLKRVGVTHMVWLPDTESGFLWQTLHDDPEDFRPDRFVGKQPEAGTWIPFGGGVRRCLGAGFSVQEAGAVLRAVLTRYDLRPERAKPVFPKPRNITLTPSRGGRVIATPR